MVVAGRATGGGRGPRGGGKGGGLGRVPPRGRACLGWGRPPRGRPGGGGEGGGGVRDRGGPPAAPRPPLTPCGQRRPRDMSGPRLSPRRHPYSAFAPPRPRPPRRSTSVSQPCATRSEEHTSELQSQSNLVCRLLLEKKEDAHRVSPARLPC